jgi:glucuronoarabinoxylan endo-1,4-beta-xylanase
MIRFTSSKCFNLWTQTKAVVGCIKGCSFKLFFAFGVLALSVQAYASVSIVQNLGAAWVGSPTIMTASSPLTSKEGNWGSSAPYSLGQSFTAPVSGVLTNIQLYGSGKITANILLYLYDMGPAIQYASQPSSVVSGSNSVTTVVSGNLFSANLAIPMSAAGNDSVMRLTFSGADAVQLIGGHEYMFAMVSTNSSPMYWDDGGGSPYSGGAAYRQNSALNGGTTTDFSLAVTLINTNTGQTIYDCVVDWNNVHQRIDGFGASSAWQSTWTMAQADMFFSTNSGTGTTIVGSTNFTFTGIGLSLLRSRVNTNGTGTYENSIMQMAQARGAKVWSTPWSPPPQFKDNGNVNGGNYLGSGANATNLAYAKLLAQYVVNMKSQYGVTIYALSIQNEPDVATSYESCQWTAQQFHDFATNLSSALAAQNVASTKIILAEDEHWQTNYYATAMMDPAVATNISIVACHNYDGSPPNNIPAALPTYANTNAALWETETSLIGGNTDYSMASGIFWAGRIHQFMTVAQVNAWHYWWLISDNSDDEGLTDSNGNPTKRMYVLGQYSRFIRPGNFRIDLANYNPYAVLSSAYKDPVSGNFAIVVANTNSTATTQSFCFTNFTATTVTPWITSSTLSLAVQSPVTVTNSVFSYTIPAMSVVTFVGTQTSGPVTPMISSAPTASSITYGQSLANSILSGGAATNAAGAPVAGSFAFTVPSTIPGAGTPSVSVTFTPTDTNNYTTATTSIYMTVHQQTPVITIVPTASSITYGQKLTNSILSGGTATNAAGATVAGSFAFSMPSTIPGAGTPSEAVTFTPTDTTDYATASASVNVTVNKATATVVVTPYSVIYNGSAHTASVTSITGVNGETGGTVGTVTLPASQTAAGIYSDSWTFAGTANYNNIGSTPITDTITKATATVMVTPYSVTYDGSAHTATAGMVIGVNGESGAAVGAVILTGTTHTAAGTYSSDTWALTGGANYNSIGATTITDTINQATPSFSELSSVTNSYGVASITLTGTVSVAGSLYPASGETVSATINGFSVNGTVTDGTGDFSISYNDPSLATNGVTSSPYPITYNYDGNANLVLAADSSTSLTITNALLSITATDSKNYGDTKTYGAGSTAFICTGLMNGETVGTVTIMATDSPSGAGATDPVGNYDLTPSAATGGTFNANNYLITYTNGLLTVSPATITVTADNQNKTVGLPNPALTASYSGFVNGEDTNTLTTLASMITMADSGSPAGGYPITPSGATAANYTFNYVSGTLTVVAQPVLAGVTAGTQGFGLSFPTLPGQLYQVEYKTNLTDAVWIPIGNPIPGTGGSVSVTNNAGELQGFYLLQILQP